MDCKSFFCTAAGIGAVGALALATMLWREINRSRRPCARRERRHSDTEYEHEGEDSDIEIEESPLCAAHCPTRSSEPCVRRERRHSDTECEHGGEDSDIEMETEELFIPFYAEDGPSHCDSLLNNYHSESLAEVLANQSNEEVMGDEYGEEVETEEVMNEYVDELERMMMVTEPELNEDEDSNDGNFERVYEETESVSGTNAEGNFSYYRWFLTRIGLSRNSAAVSVDQAEEEESVDQGTEEVETKQDVTEVKDEPPIVETMEPTINEPTDEPSDEPAWMQPEVMEAIAGYISAPFDTLQEYIGECNMMEAIVEPATEETITEPIAESTVVKAEPGLNEDTDSSAKDTPSFYDWILNKIGLSGTPAEVSVNESNDEVIKDHSTKEIKIEKDINEPKGELALAESLDSMAEPYFTENIVEPSTPIADKPTDIERPVEGPVYGPTPEPKVTEAVEKRPVKEESVHGPTSESNVTKAVDQRPVEEPIDESALEPAEPTLMEGIANCFRSVCEALEDSTDESVDEDSIPDIYVCSECLKPVIEDVAEHPMVEPAADPTLAGSITDLVETITGIVEPDVMEAVAEQPADDLTPEPTLTEFIADVVEVISEGIESAQSVVDECLEVIAEGVESAQSVVGECLEAVAECFEPVAECLEPLAAMMEYNDDPILAIAPALPVFAENNDELTLMETIAECAKPIIDSIVDEMEPHDIPASMEDIAESVTETPLVETIDEAKDSVSVEIATERAQVSRLEKKMRKQQRKAEAILRKIAERRKSTAVSNMSGYEAEPSSSNETPEEKRKRSKQQRKAEARLRKREERRKSKAVCNVGGCEGESSSLHEPSEETWFFSGCATDSQDEGPSDKKMKKKKNKNNSGVKDSLIEIKIEVSTIEIETEEDE